MADNKSSSTEKFVMWKKRNSIYLVAACAALAMTMLIAPEVHETDSMSPTIGDGAVVVLSKESYNPNNEIPEVGDIVVMDKDAIPYIPEDNAIRRVVALGGDHVVTEEGRVYVNESLIVEYQSHSEVPKVEYLLESHEVFIVCDNEQYDGDFMYDIVDMRDIRGKAVFKIWPFEEFGGIE